MNRLTWAFLVVTGAAFGPLDRTNSLREFPPKTLAAESRRSGDVSVRTILGRKGLRGKSLTASIRSVGKTSSLFSVGPLFFHLAPRHIHAGDPTIRPRAFPLHIQDFLIMAVLVAEWCIAEITAVRRLARSG